MKIASLAALFFAGILSSAFAGKVTFDFSDPKAGSSLTFKLDAPNESISGTGTGFSGTVTLDPATFQDLAGEVTVTATSLQVPNPLMNYHMHGSSWLDAAKFPEISFVIKKVSDVKKTGDTATGSVTGTLTLHGVSKELTAPASVTLVSRTIGDQLVIRSEFTVARGDYGIQPGLNESKVAKDVKIALAVTGTASRVVKR